MIYYVFDTGLTGFFSNSSKFDLYSKADVLPNVVQLTPYYQSLIDKYIPGTIKW